MSKRRRFGVAVAGGVLVPLMIWLIGSDIDHGIYVSAVALIFLCVICVVGYTQYEDLEKQHDQRNALYDERNRQYDDLQTRFDELQKRYDAAVLGSSMVDRWLNHPKRPVDNHNRYTLIKLVARIDDNGDYHARYERFGVNHSGASVDRLRILTTADSNADFAQLDLNAVDVLHNRSLKHRCIDDDLHEKLFEIFFETPLQPNEEFGIAWSLLWPRVMRASSDYDFIVLKGLTRGVQKLTYTLHFDRELSTYQFEKLGSNKEWEFLRGTKQQGGSSFSYTLDLENPNCDAYRFSYTR